MAVDDLRKKVKALEAQVAEMRTKDVSLDIVSVLSVVLPMFTGRLTLETAQTAASLRGMHGHGLVMLLLADLEARAPGSLLNKTLYEIGTTRERLPGQGSSEKLAIFCTLLGMKFVTIDMDPANTARIRMLLPLVNPGSSAFSFKGEAYFDREAGPFDFVYLDAFDFHHDKHSAERQARYKKNLGVEIRDELCWKMHLECARNMAPKMPVGGVVVIDDTVTVGDGTYDRKGKLAVPYLLANGFEHVLGTENAIALRKKAAAPALGAQSGV